MRPALVDATEDDHLVARPNAPDEVGRGDRSSGEHAPGASQRRRRRREILVIASADRVVEDDSLVGEDVHRLPVELEADLLDGRKLRQRVDDLREAELHRERTAAGLELGGEVDRRDAVLDRDPEQPRVGRNGRRRPGPTLGLGRAGEQRVHGGGRHVGRRAACPCNRSDLLTAREPDLERRLRGERARDLGAGDHIRRRPQRDRIAGSAGGEEDPERDAEHSESSDYECRPHRSLVPAFKGRLMNASCQVPCTRFCSRSETPRSRASNSSDTTNRSRAPSQREPAIPLQH